MERARKTVTMLSWSNLVPGGYFTLRRQEGTLISAIAATKIFFFAAACTIERGWESDVVADENFHQKLERKKIIIV
jgi:hypothetical protein